MNNFATRDSLPPEVLADLRVYTASREFSFADGEDITKPTLNLYFSKGDVFEYARGTLIHLGRVYTNINQNRFHAVLALDWGKLDQGQEPDPVVIREKRARNLLKKESVPVAAPQNESNNSVNRQTRGLVQYVNGVEVLPSDWADYEWSMKRAYISQMTDVDLLEDMAYDEEDRIKRIIEKRVSFLKDPSAVHAAPPVQQQRQAPAQQAAQGTNTAAPAQRGRVSNVDPSQSRFKSAAENTEVTATSDVAEYEEMSGEEIIKVEFSEKAAAPPDKRRGRPRKDVDKGNLNATIELSEALSDFETLDGQPIEGFDEGF